MFEYLKQMENRLSDFDKKRLKAIYAPTVVAVPPHDARRNMCIMPNGDIRLYGLINKQSAHGDGDLIYLSSSDCGLSWKMYEADKKALGSGIQNPYTGEYMTVKAIDDSERKGTYSIVGKDPDDTNPSYVKIVDWSGYDAFLPTAMQSRKRIFSTTYKRENGKYTPIFMYTDDNGKNWSVVTLKSTPKHEAVFPHLGKRWENNGSEPIAVELASGRLVFLARTSLDCFYIYYSDDGGETWTDGELSDFHGTLTTPFFLRLSDGRVLLTWCNTQPLPELNKKKLFPPVDNDVQNGVWEDVFTNRDACHAAISSDGISWRGFREMFLNTIRNDADHRTKGGPISGNDKSVHQFQSIELPFNKVLVALGQHDIARKAVIFDLDWLLEKDRSEDFSYGLENISTHTYVRSISGTSTDYGFAGHCAWNRTNGPLLVPDPDATYGEALQLARIDDERLFSQKQGAVWNFYASMAGEVEAQVRVDGCGMRVSLLDRWINPIDDTVRDDAQFSFVIDENIVDKNMWMTLRIQWDCSAKKAVVYCDGHELFSVKMKNDTVFGISYLHMQSISETKDFKGCLIRKLHKTHISD